MLVRLFVSLSPRGERRQTRVGTTTVNRHDEKTGKDFSRYFLRKGSACPRGASFLLCVCRERTVREGGESRLPTDPENSRLSPIPRPPSCMLNLRAS